MYRPSRIARRTYLRRWEDRPLSDRAMDTSETNTRETGCFLADPIESFFGKMTKIPPRDPGYPAEAPKCRIDLYLEEVT